MPDNTYLVDTSAWLLVLGKNFIPEVKDRIYYLLGEDAIITTGMIRLELLSGTKTKKDFIRLKSRLDSLAGIETEHSVWQRASELGFELRRKGITVPHTDVLIAECARNRDAVVFHADNHFDLIAKYVHVKVESFVQAARKRTAQK